MYTILQLYCTKEITISIQEAVQTLGSNIQIISCDSVSNAQEVLSENTVNCIVADLNNYVTETIPILQEWQKHIDYCRNAIVLFADNENVVMKILTHIHFCEVYFNEPTERRKLMITTFLNRHYSLHQQLYHPHHSSFPEDSIFIKTSEGNINCRLSDILYIEAFKHKSIVHTKNEAFIVSKQFSKLLECPLLKEFKKSHRSFLVNLLHIKQIDRSISPWVIIFNDSNKHAYVSRTFQKIFDENTIKRP